jgi:hypothetical protein
VVASQTENDIITTSPEEVLRIKEKRKSLNENL